MKKVISNTRLHLLIIAAALLLTSIFAGLSAYLVGDDELGIDFVTTTAGNLEIDVTAPHYDRNQTLLPGETASVDPYVTNSSDIPVYVFIELESDDDSLSVTGALGSGWAEVSPGLYAYGSASALTPVAARSSDESSTPGSTSTPAFNTVQLDSSLTGDTIGSTYVMTIHAYAIQTVGLGTSDPATVFGLIS